MKTQIAESAHLDAVLRLQHEYHIDTIGSRERGFLTFKVDDVSVLSDINNELGIIVLLENAGAVVGYNILFTYERASIVDLYRPLVSAYREKFPEVDTSTIAVSAQYCVQEGVYRGGLGVRMMFNEQRRILRNAGIKISLGEVDSRNRISTLTVLRMLAYKKFGSISVNDISWNLFLREE